MRINVLGKLPQDFFKGLASKNAEIYIDCLDIISTMNGSLSFKEKYEDVKERIRVYLEDAKVTVNNEEDFSFSANLDRRPGEIISQMIRYGWLETDTKEGTFEKEIYVTKYAHLLYTVFLKQIDSPKKIEFSNYIISIYNLVRNRDTWEDNPYYSFLKPVYQATEELSNALTEMNTYAKDMIAEMTIYDNYYDITEALIRNSVDDFSEEFSRLSSKNIHWFRTGRPGSPGIVDGLEGILEDTELIERMAAEYGRENNVNQIEARNEVLDMIYGVIEFMSDKYDRLYDDIRMKIERYVDTMIGRLRFIRRLHESDDRENLTKFLEAARIKLDLGEDLSDTDAVFDLYRQEIIYPEQVCRKREFHTVKKQVVKNVRKLEAKDRDKAIENLRKKADNPFTIEKVQEFIEENSKDGVMDSRDIALEDKMKFLLTLAGAMYSSGLGYKYSGDKNYHRSGDYRMKDFVLRKEEAHD